MKDSFLLPLRLGIRFFLITAAIFLLVFLYYFVIEYSPSIPVGAQWIASRSIVAISYSLLPAALITIVYGYFILIKHPGRMILSFLSFFLCIGLMLSASNIVTKALEEVNSPALQASVHENTFLNYSGEVIYINHKGGQNVTGAVHLSTNIDNNPRFHVYDNGYIVADTGMLKLDDTTIVLEPVNPEISTIIGIPLFVSNVIRDLRLFKLILSGSLKNILMFSLFFSSLWVFSRVGSWPLFNILILTAFMRLTLISIFIIELPLSQRVLAAWSLSSGKVLTIFFFTASALLIVWDIFFVPYPKSNRKKDMEK